MSEEYEYIEWMFALRVEERVISGTMITAVITQVRVGSLGSMPGTRYLVIVAKPNVTNSHN